VPARRKVDWTTDVAAYPKRSILDPLTEPQQRFVEVVGEVYAAQPGTWPVFDYVQGLLDMERIDAVETFESFPSVNVHGIEYRAIWSPGGPRNWPQPDQLMALTVVGMHHCNALRGRFPRSTSIPVIDLPDAFLALVRWAARVRREAEPSPTTVRNVEITSNQVFNALIERYRFDQLPPRLLYDLIEKEPPFWGSGGSVDGDGNAWRRSLPRNLFDYEDVTDIAAYADRLLLQQPAAPTPPPAAPSPFDLVAALDYLNAVWELEFGRRLFQFHVAERIAKLSFPAVTREEFDAHASAVVDILRQADASLDPAPAVQKGRGRKKRDHPLVRFEAHLLNKLDPPSEDLIRRHVDVLEAILFVREAGQHSGAGRRGAAAMIELGAGFPPRDWESAWAIIERCAIESLSAIREELQTHRAAHAAGP
jgi:hypothetical protein